MRALLLAFALAAPTLAGAQSDTLRARATTWVAPLEARTDTANIYFVRGGARQLGVTYIEEVAKTPEGWLVTQKNVRPDGQVLSLDSVQLAAGSLAPLWHSDMTPRGRMRVEFVNGRVRGTSTTPAGVTTPVDTAIPPGAMDFSVSGMLSRLLPLRAGYSSVLVTNDIHRGVVYVAQQVTGEEEIEVAGRKLKTWAISRTTQGRTTKHWIDQASRREVRVTVDMGNGATMEMEPVIR